MNYLYILSLITTTAEATACLLCARILRSLNREHWDRSRRLLAQGSGLVGMLAILMILASVFFADNAQGKAPMLAPWLLYLILVVSIIMALYPVTIVNEKWLTRKKALIFFLPVAIFFLVFLGFSIAGAWTPVYTREEIWDNIWKADVLLRLAALLAMVPYCIIILFFPYNYRHSSASFLWILSYCIGLTVLYTAHILLVLTNWPVIIVVIPILVSLFFLFSTEYELEHRIIPQDNDSADEVVEERAEPALGELELWERICIIMDQEDAWRDPDFTLGSLAQKCATNITYLNREINKHTGGGFKELVNSKRVRSVENQLRINPDLDIQTAFFNAGYRSRATAWRNFKEIMGVTPTEFRQSLKRIG